MQRFVGLWLTLLFSYIFAWTVISGIGFNSWDLRYDSWIKLVVLPFVQALALCTAIFGLRIPAVGALLRNSIRQQPVIGLLLVVDVVILLAGWIMQDWRLTDLTARGSIPGNYTGLKALATSLLVAQMALKRSWRSSERLWLLLFACGVAVLGLDYFFTWSARLPEKMFTSLLLLFRWLILYGPLFIVSILVLLKVGAIWRAFSETAATWISAAVIFALLNAMVVVSNVFNRPFLLPPWSILARTLGFLAISFIWIAVFDLRSRIIGDRPQLRDSA